MTTPITEQTTPDPAPAAWRSAPWVMACLAIALLAGPLLNSANNTQPVLNWYQSSGLKALEWDNYLSWLRFNNQSALSRSEEHTSELQSPD